MTATLCFSGTFDVVYTSAETISPDSNAVQVISSFIENSEAKGVLYVFMYTDNNNVSVDFSRSLYFPVSRLLATDGITIAIPRGSYRVLSYDIESNNHLQRKGPPADADALLVNGHHFGNCA